MTEIRLGDFLSEYTSEIPEAVVDGNIYKLTYSADLTEISFYVKFTKLIPYKDVIAFEKHLEGLLNLDKINLHCTYQPELFSMDYYNDLISKLKRRLAVVNGFLDNADVNYGDGLITIGLKNGGYDLLVRANFCGELSKLINDEFGIKINVELTGEHNVDAAEHEKMMEEVRASLPAHTEQLSQKPASSDETA
ncbi:MAG: PolC-type DNA polymerase III, partial [Porcipelethomonas sp.]